MFFIQIAHLLQIYQYILGADEVLPLKLLVPELSEVALFEEVLPLGRLLLTEVVNIAINTNIPIPKTKIIVPQTTFPILLKNHVI